MSNATIDDILALPFVRRTTKAERKASGRSFVWWGGIASTGDYDVDGRAGHAAALAYLDFEAKDVGGSGCLQHIVSDMPCGKLGGLEVGFLTIVSYAAAAGRARAFRTVEHWATQTVTIKAALA